MSTRLLLRIGIATLLAGLGAACGDVYVDPVVSVFGNSAPRPPAFDASASIPQDLVGACPTTPGIENTSCSTPGMTCEVGSSPDVRCNLTVSCVPDPSFSRTWVARPSVLCPTYECPRGASAAVDGTPCDVPSVDAGAPADADELVCAMDDAVCACTTGTDAAHAHARTWVCVKPLAGCPAKRPLTGQGCSGGPTCDYGSCAFKRGMRMECKDQVWTSVSATCN